MAPSARSIQFIALRLCCPNSTALVSKSYGPIQPSGGACGKHRTRTCDSDTASLALSNPLDGQARDENDCRATDERNGFIWLQAEKGNQGCQVLAGGRHRHERGDGPRRFACIAKGWGGSHRRSRICSRCRCIRKSQDIKLCISKRSLRLV